jgi:hypothetical protein
MTWWALLSVDVGLVGGLVVVFGYVLRVATELEQLRRELELAHDPRGERSDRYEGPTSP